MYIFEQYKSPLIECFSSCVYLTSPQKCISWISWLDSGYVFLAWMIHEWCCIRYPIRRHTISVCPSLAMLVLITWSTCYTISPICRHYFPLEISKQSVGRHFKTMQISCFSSKCFSRLCNAYYSGCKMMIFQFQSSFNTVGTQILL